MPLAILLLPLGAFAIGTGNFAFVGVLDALAADIGVSVATAGQLTTVFAVAYALSAPILVALTSRLPRRLVLLGVGGVLGVPLGGWLGDRYPRAGTVTGQGLARRPRPL